MKKFLPNILWLLSSSLLFACQKTIPPFDNSDSTQTQLFDTAPVIHPVTPIINEGSGIADSKVNPGFLWVEEDSGNPPWLYVLGHDGNVLKTIYIKGATNRDWEDMCLAGDTIYVADIGDNNAKDTEYYFYRFAEPLSSVDTVTSFDVISFKYPDGAHDAEAFLIDPQTKDIYIMTKRDNPSRIYKLSFPYSTTSVNAATFVGTLPYSIVTSACISQDGKEIIVKIYPALYYYVRLPGQSIVQALQNNYLSIPYKMESQGEAVTFSQDNSGYFTLSEKGLATFVNLYFYPRK
jgi:hypothetical protein